MPRDDSACEENCEPATEDARSLEGRLKTRGDEPHEFRHGDTADGFLDGEIILGLAEGGGAALGCLDPSPHT